jgi:hypothetical protein
MDDGLFQFDRFWKWLVQYGDNLQKNIRTWSEQLDLYGYGINVLDTYPWIL